VDEVDKLENQLNKENCKLSVVFSFRQEQEVLPELIRRIRAVLKNEKIEGIIKSYELIFVNDASTDNSIEVLKEQSKGNSDIRIINMSRRFGVTPCVLAGLEYSSGDAVIYMDTDLQDPPEVIPKLLREWQSQEVEVVHTVREFRKGESKIKLLITRLGYTVLKKLSSIDLPIEAGDFKLLSRRAVNHILTLRENNPYMRGLVSWIGFNQSFVPYHREPRYAGETKFFVLGKDVLGNFFGSALISFSSAPLRIASWIGLFAIFIDFIFVGHTLYEKFLGRAIPGWTALMIVILFIGGVQLFCVGIMGLYLNSVFVQSKGRPNYIIDHTIGFTHDTSRKEVHQ